MRYFFTGTIIAAILTTAILMTFSFTETAFAAQGTGSACGKGGCTPNTGGSESGSGSNAELLAAAHSAMILLVLVQVIQVTSIAAVAVVPTTG